MVGLDNATWEIKPGDDLIVDGLLGRVILNPDDKVLERYRRRQLEFGAFKLEVARFCTYSG